MVLVPCWKMVSAECHLTTALLVGVKSGGEAFDKSNTMFAQSPGETLFVQNRGIDADAKVVDARRTRRRSAFDARPIITTNGPGLIWGKSSPVRSEPSQGALQG